MIHPTPLYIVASPRQRVGKTLIARLLIDFLLTSERPLEGYDLHPHEPALAKRFPGFVAPIDIGDVSGQMQLFDRLLAHDFDHEGSRFGMQAVCTILRGDVGDRLCHRGTAAID